MSTPKPSEEQRRLVSVALFGRKHGVPTARPATKPRVESDEAAARHRLEDLAEARRLARELADYRDD